MKATKGQIEDKISKEITSFYATELGVGPKQSKTYLIDDMVIVRLKGKLLPIEENLLKLTGQKGIELVKKIRESFDQVTAEKLSTLISKITGCNVISAHSDISTRTREKMQIFVLDRNLQKQLEKDLELK